MRLTRFYPALLLLLLTFVEIQASSLQKTTPFPGTKSEWKAHDCYTFQFEGRTAKVVVPRSIAPDRPWIWRPAFFGAFPFVDEKILLEGYHVVFFDLTHGYGSPQTIEAGERFFDHMVSTYSLSPHVVLEGFSRGGYCALQFAVKNPDKVACIYLDAPVCDLLSWPGRTNEKQWKEVLERWNTTDEAMNSFLSNPGNHLEPLAIRQVPILSVCGDSDKVVPYPDNTKVLHTRYRALGGSWRTILKPGVDHHPHSLVEPSPVIDFILSHQSGYDRYQYIELRNTMTNSLLRMARDGEATVAFLSKPDSSVNGWSMRISQSLRQRFPDTRFLFIYGGPEELPTASIDLLLFDPSVSADPESIVRKVRRANPLSDLAILHTESGSKQLQCEKMAADYGISTVDLVREVNERTAAGESLHTDFALNRCYAATINRLFDRQCNVRSLFELRPVAHPLPATRSYSAH